MSRPTPVLLVGCGWVDYSTIDALPVQCQALDGTGAWVAIGRPGHSEFKGLDSCAALGPRSRPYGAQHCAPLGDTKVPMLCPQSVWLLVAKQGSAPGARHCMCPTDVDHSDVE
jgi:hypothetical protein